MILIFARESSIGCNFINVSGLVVCLHQSGNEGWIAELKFRSDWDILRGQQKKTRLGLFI